MKSAGDIKITKSHISKVWESINALKFTVLDKCKTKMFTKVNHFKLTAYSENKNKNNGYVSKINLDQSIYFY